MKRYLVLLIISLGCAKAPGPVLSIDPASVNEIRSIGIKEVVNSSPQQEITPIVMQNLTTNLSELKRYKLVSPDEADAILNCIITQYLPIQEKIVRSGKDVSYDVHEFEGTKTEAKEGHGLLWGCLIDLLIPSQKIKGGEEYKYKTVTRSPTIELKITLNKKDKIIYEGYKLIRSGSRIPDCYNTTYADILADEQLNSIDFIVRLAIKELLEPLRGSTSR
ncbi:MAG: hypothetical protein HY769_06070 [Candidatus Stahlbacteria bacterium]|nr:hypothetical protein [Candidatus Stahlbacteria bacterium]